MCLINRKIFEKSKPVTATLTEVGRDKENILEKEFVYPEKSSLDYESEKLQEWINLNIDVGYTHANNAPFN